MTLDQNKIIAVGLEELMSKSYDMVLYRLKKRKVNNAPEADYLRSVMEIQKMKDVFETAEQLERENPGIYEEWYIDTFKKWIEDSEKKISEFVEFYNLDTSKLKILDWPEDKYPNI